MGERGGVTLYMRCRHPARSAAARMIPLCDLTAPFRWLRVRLNFGRAHLADWARIHDAAMDLLARAAEAAERGAP